jgi:hypothetical protein
MATKRPNHPTRRPTRHPDRPTPRADRPTPRGAAPPLPPNRTNWAKRLRVVRRRALAARTGAASAARAVGGWALAAAGGETGRRLARAAGLMVVLAALVLGLYDQGEVPVAAAQPAVRAPAAAGPAGQQARAGAGRRRDPVQPGGLRGRDRPAQVGERPATVAAAWYADRHGLPRAKVKALQQDRLSAREVRVLVMADHGRGRLRTALVRVRLGAAGWSVR